MADNLKQVICILGCTDSFYIKFNSQIFARLACKKNAKSTAKNWII